MRRASVVAFVAVIGAGCGRLSFDSVMSAGDGDVDTAPAVCAQPVGHDEDGDSVDDICDTCPHLPVKQLDTDGDGVGDACDPEPANPRQRIALFATMRPGDQPFAPNTTGGVWTPLADSIAYDGGGFGGLKADLAFTNGVFAMGFAVTGQTNSPDAQHQLEILPPNDDLTFTEVGLNATGTNNVPDAVIAHWNGAMFQNYTPVPTASGIHPGALTITGTYLAGTSVSVDVGWPGEPYHVELSPFAGYQSAQHLELHSNNVAFAVEWVCVIAW